MGVATAGQPAQRVKSTAARISPAGPAFRETWPVAPFVRSHSCRLCRLNLENEMSMRITALQSENVKRLKAISIQPDGNLVVIGGRNGQGKTSAIDSVWYALAGKGALPAKPVREGQAQAVTSVRIEGGGEAPLIVTRKIKPDGESTLTVEEDKGNGRRSTLKSPQTLLASLIGRVAFDPLEFIRQKPKDQIATLQEIVGVDTSEVDSRIREAVDNRLESNRETKRLSALVASLPVHDNVPEQEQSAAEVLAKIKEGQATNTAADEAERLAYEAESKADRCRDVVRAASERLSELQKEMDAAVARRDEARSRLDSVVKEAEWLREAADAMPRVDLADLQVSLSAVESVNALVRDNVAAAKAREELAAAEAEATERQNEVDSANQARLDLMKSAKWPVAGLGFSEDGVQFNGLPIDQCSSAEQLKISVAIGACQNAKLPLMFIRDGSLLDDDSLDTVRALAEEHDLQVWMERVGDGEECTVVIEDGEVVRRESGESA